MARLNARQKRARKVRVALLLLAQARNPSTVSQTGDVRASTKSFEGGAHKAPAGTYKVAAVRPTIKSGKKKSGVMERKSPIEFTPSTVVHDHGNKAQRVTAPFPKGKQAFKIDGFRKLEVFEELDIPTKAPLKR